MIIFHKLFQKLIQIKNKAVFQKFYSSKRVELMKYLNVAEKHDAAKNIANILSNGSARRREGLCVYNKVFDFEANVGQNCKMVMTSVSGHLLNYEFLPSYKGWNNCSPEQLFDAPIRKCILNNDTGEKIKKTIEREIRSCQGLIIWTDCDREGENIGFEVLEICQAIRSNLKIFRAKFSELTRTAIFRALNNLSQPDHRQNEAVNIRQELDLRTGAAFTRYQTLRLQKIFPGTTAQKLISYGSCQIPTLGFVAERYKEVEDFLSEPFWKLVVTHTIEPLTVEFNWARNRLFNKEAVEDYLLLCLADPKAKVENKTVKPKNKWRPQPMDTVELEKLGSRKLKINAKEIMNIAEKLYNKGFISYPRTETNSFSSNTNLSALVEQHTPHPEWGDFASKVLQWNPNPRNGKKTDEAHPPIHPIKFTTSLDGNEARVYELIVRHFLACVSKDATGSETIVYIDIAGEKFSANGLVIYERNYLEVYPYENWNAKQIHHYEIGQIFEPTEISMREGATTAPPLLNEADLIVLMEKNGIGTDATHAEHIHTIKERGYIGEVEKGLLVPGTIGMGLYEGYGAMDLELAKPRLRAEFESDLKKICVGEKDAKTVLREQIAKYKEAYYLITQRISAMDEKFANRVNETPSNRRNDGDQGPGSNGSSGRNNNNNHGDDDDDDDDDDNGHGHGNNPSRPGYNSRNFETNYEEGIPQPLQEAFPCPKCKIYKMVLKKKKDGNSYLIGCLNFPTCKNVVWLSDAIKEAKLSESYCNRCGNKTNEKSLSKKIEFKFKSNTYLALLNSVDPTYKTCIRCDSKFREIFDINLDQVKCVGNIVGETSAGSSKTDIKKKNSTKKPKIEPQKRNFSTNLQSISDHNNPVTSLGSVFDNDDFFDNDGFGDELDEVLVNLGTSLEQENANSNSNLYGTSNSRKTEFKNFKNKKEIDAYLTSWNKTSISTINNSKQPSSTLEWKTSQSSSNNSRSTSIATKKQIQGSKWINLSDFENENCSDNNWFSAGSSSNKQCEESGITKYTKDDFKQRNLDQSRTNYNLAEKGESGIKCKACNKIARKNVVKKEGPNTGREFYACDSTCNFFQWADEPLQTTRSSVSGAQRGSSSQTSIATQKCDCNRPSILLQVRKEGPNQGKSFYTCSSKKCSFFKWAEDGIEDSHRINSTSSSWGTSKNDAKQNTENKINAKKRKCGLCRMEGHTKNKCPRQQEFGEF